MMWFCIEFKLIFFLVFVLLISVENLCKVVVLLLNVKYVEDVLIFYMKIILEII